MMEKTLFLFASLLGDLWVREMTLGVASLAKFLLTGVLVFFFFLENQLKNTISRIAL
jgi:hypothetical protein